MRLLLSALLMAATATVSAQNPSSNPKAAQNSVGPGTAVNNLVAHRTVPFSADTCPLTLTSVRFSGPATYMPVSTADQVMEPNLALGFLNSSGKAIHSVAVTARLRVKKDVYALDAAPVDVRLSFAGTQDLDRELDQLATLPLPKNLHSYGVVQVRLDQVIFADGTLWKASKSTACEVGNSRLIATR